MEYIKQREFPSGSENIIKEQYILNKKIYLITHDGVKWKLFKLEEGDLKGKKIGGGRDLPTLYERIPEK